MVSKKNSLFLLLCALFCVQINGMEQRDLIMIIDDPMEGVKPEERQQGDTTLLQVTENLITKAAPMIISNYTWRNFAQSRYNFNQKKNDPKAIESIIYNQIYTPMSKEINNVAKQSKDPKTIADIVNKTAQSVCENTIPSIEKKIDPTKLVERQILEKEFICFSIPFNPAEWDVYTYKHALYILIPHEYANRIQKEYPKKSLEKLTFKDHKTGKTLDKNMALLGINTTHLTKLTISDPYKLPYEEPQTNFSIHSGLPMNEILVTNKDVIKNKKTRIVHPFLWNVFLMGHGSYYVRPDLQQQLDEVPNDIQKHKQAIEQLTGISFKYADYESVITQLQLRIEQAPVADKEKFEKALTHAEELKDNYMWAYNQIFNSRNIMIAGMPALAFTKLLQFFNDDVDTSFLFYETCYSGTRNLLFPYLAAFGQPIQYNYSITTSTVNDQVTFSQSQPIFTIAGMTTTINGQATTSYFYNNNCSIDPSNIYVENNKTTLIGRRGEERFKQFFEALHTNKPILETLNYVRTGKEITGEKPVIRLPRGTAFTIDDVDTKIQRVSRVILSIANMQGKLTIDGNKKPGVVLNTYFIPVPINFVNTLPTSITSSIYEPTLQEAKIGAITGFYFKEITMPKSFGHGTLTHLADLLLQGALVKEINKTRQRGDSPIPKLFLCDKLIFTFDNTVYEKMLIFNNALLPFSLIKGEVSDDADTFTTGMIYTQDGKITMNVWETTENYESGARTTEHIERQLTEQKEIEDYNALFDSAKDELTQKANSEGLNIIPLETLTKALQSRTAQTTPGVK